MTKNAKFYDYWEGDDLIILTSEMVHADWRNNRHAVAFANRAFRVFYDARRHIKSISDSKHQKLMLDKLENAAREGSKVFGWGDLETVFEKMARDGADRNQWRDDETDRYRPAATHLPVKQTIWSGEGEIIAPYASVHFMKAMDANLQELGSTSMDFLKEWDKLLKMKRKQSDHAAYWKGVGGVFDTIKSGADKAAPFLWLAPESIEHNGHRYFGYLGHIANIKDIADGFFKWSDKGYRPAAAAQMALLQKGLSFLPVLGAFYAAALDMIPGLKIWFTRLYKQREQLWRSLEREAQGRAIHRGRGGG